MPHPMEGAATAHTSEFVIISELMLFYIRSTDRFASKKPNSEISKFVRGRSPLFGRDFEENCSEAY